MNKRQTILLLSANPLDTERLRLDVENEKIKQGLKASKYRERFSIESHQAVRAADIHRALLEHAPDIVHFSGHGEGGEGIVLEDDNGCSSLVNAEALAQLFKLFGDEVQCVLLNACYSEIQAAAIAEHIDYVIGMKRAFSDNAAISFSGAFYDAIGAGKSVEFAFKLGCVATQMQGIPENLTPALKKRSQKPMAAAGIAPDADEHFEQFTVFLAEVSDDLQARRQNLQTALEQMNISVLPQSMYFFPALDALQTQLDRDLARADLYVQLLSANNPQRPPGIGMTTPMLQYQRATEASLPMLQWRDPALLPAATEDAEMHQLLNGPEVIAGELGEFKQTIRSRLAAIAQARRAPAEVGAGKETGQKNDAEPPFVFIDAAPEDDELARRVEQVIDRRGLDYCLPLLDPDAAPAEIRADLEGSLCTGNALILVYCRASLYWLREQLRYCKRVQNRREQPLKTALVLHCPGTARADLRMKLKNLELRFVDCAEPFDPACLDVFLEGIVEP
ncbi:MAG: CHAT domain-containing protein [Gammaproteobacteria bacterium]|nr:CHAT domain-containing protein [Gammaproteobacteria bacterium]